MCAQVLLKRCGKSNITADNTNHR